MSAVIRTDGLTKRFGDVLAVDDLSLEVGEGDVYGFLGPNGSGKTTTVRMLLGLVYATSGTAEVLGRRIPDEARDALPDVGALVEGPAFYGHLSGRANLTIFDAAGPSTRRDRTSRVSEALEQVGLLVAAHRKVRTYSLGMKQRLGIAAALLRTPRLLILDEPTNGLDPAGIREVRDLLLDLRDRGTTVFLSSHLLAEVEQLCTRAGIVHKGRLIAERDVDDLLAPTGRVYVRTTETEFETRTDDVPGLVSRLVAEGARIEEVAVHRPTLEDVYLELTGDD